MLKIVVVVIVVTSMLIFHWRETWLVTNCSELGRTSERPMTIYRLFGSEASDFPVERDRPNNRT